MNEFATIIDVRTLPHTPERRTTIFNAFDDLKPGEKMQLINDHNPTMLYEKFTEDRVNQFEWELLEDGPETWRISIYKK